MDDTSFPPDSAQKLQPVDWQLVYGHGEPLLIGQWPTNTSYQGIRSVPFDCSTTASASSSSSFPPHQHSGCTPPQVHGAPANSTTPIIHIPRCRLTFRSAPYTPSRKDHHHPRDPTARVEIEEVALHRDLIQGFLSHISPPASEDGSVTARLSSTAHYDDEDEWVYSRCTLSEFTEMDRDHATFLSNNGMLCCWASVVLTPWEEACTGRTSWDLGFMVHRVGMCTERERGGMDGGGDGEGGEGECHGGCVY